MERNSTLVATSKANKKTVDRPELSRLELAVMEIVWDLDDCTSTEVIAVFQKRRPLAPTTIRTVLANLRKKGYVAPVPSVDRGFRLKATVSRSSVARRSLRDVLTNLFQGSLPQAIACLLRDEQLSDEEMLEVRKILDSKVADGKITDVARSASKKRSS